jgi:hypothetical protein
MTTNATTSAMIDGRRADSTRRRQWVSPEIVEASFKLRPTG